MKKSKNSISTFLLFSAFLMAGCSHSEKNKIVGKWLVDKAYASKRNSESQRYSTEQSYRNDSLLSSQFEGTQYQFNEDGTMTIKKGQEQISGIWKMGKDEKTNETLSIIEMKGDDWAEVWFPEIGESLFYLKGMDNSMLAKLLSKLEDGTAVVYSLSKISLE